MKRRYITLISISLLLLSNIISKAGFCSCLENWYLAGSGSVAWHNDQKFGFTMKDNHYSFARKYKRGYGGNVSIGHTIRGLECVNIRVEGEFLYREHRLYKGIFHAHKTNGKAISKTVSMNGHIKDSAIMANLIADLPIPLGCPTNFYFGLGIGASYNRLTTKVSNDYRIRGPFSRNSWLMGAQLLAGLSYQWTNCIVLTLGYRLFSTSEVLTERDLLRSNNRPIIQSVDLGIRFQM